MKNRRTFGLACAVVAVQAMTSAALAVVPAVKSPTATAELHDPAGKSLGVLTLTDSGSGVMISGTLKGLPAGVRAIHFHEVGKCSPNFAAAGSHFNPSKRDHGLLNTAGHHVGDLPNLTVNDKGEAHVEAFASHATLRDGDNSLLAGNGTAIVIHKGQDNHQAMPTGSDAERIACGVVSAK